MDILIQELLFSRINFGFLLGRQSSRGRRFNVVGHPVVLILHLAFELRLVVLGEHLNHLDQFCFKKINGLSRARFSWQLLVLRNQLIRYGGQ